MGTDRTKSNDNIYFRCRKEAAKYNDKLNSRESTADLLGVSVSSLADYELGNTKVVPVDKVVLMADLYNAPQLLNSYCATECPIGCRREMATELQTLERTTLSLLDLFSQDKLGRMMTALTSIAADGKVERKEREKMDEIVCYLNEIRVRIEELTLYDDKRRGSDR
nr:MAG TPA: regulatory protein [Caudoviricetes sp.]